MPPMAQSGLPSVSLMWVPARATLPEVSVVHVALWHTLELPSVIQSIVK